MTNPRPTLLAADPSQDAVTHLRALTTQLAGAFLERTAEIRCLAVALVAGEHCFLFGKPGTGKSALTRAFAHAVGDATEKPFEYLLTKYSTPEELFGQLDIAALRAGKYVRITRGKLPDARVAFLDEIFKANSAILNALLTALNEREFDDGSCRRSIPLEIVIGASNELPEDESLAALYDRFLFRRDVKTLGSEQNRRALFGGHRGQVTARVSWDDVRELRGAAQAVDLAPVEDLVFQLLAALRQHGIEVSDRRLVKIAGALRAVAAVDGRDQSVPEDLRILADCLWDEPEQREAISACIRDLVGESATEAASKIVQGALEVVARVDMKADDVVFLRRASEANTEVRKMLSELRDLGPEVVDQLHAVEAAVRPMREELASRLGTR